jgi:hypothetical protein
MKIRAVQMASMETGILETETAQFVMLEVSGPFDPNHAVLARARELAAMTGSQSMIESFERSLSRGAFPGKR